MGNIRCLIDEAKSFQTVGDLRRPDLVTCPHYSSEAIIKDGRDKTQPDCQRYLCRSCRKRFGDLTGTILAGDHQPLRTWVFCLYFAELNPSRMHIAKELDLNRGDVQSMVHLLHH